MAPPARCRSRQENPGGDLPHRDRHPAPSTQAVTWSARPTSSPRARDRPECARSRPEGAEDDSATGRRYLDRHLGSSTLASRPGPPSSSDRRGVARHVERRRPLPIPSRARRCGSSLGVLGSAKRPRSGSDANGIHRAGDSAGDSSGSSARQATAGAPPPVSVSAAAGTGKARTRRASRDCRSGRANEELVRASRAGAGPSRSRSIAVRPRYACESPRQARSRCLGPGGGAAAEK